MRRICPFLCVLVFVVGLVAPTLTSASKPPPKDEFWLQFAEPGRKQWVAAMKRAARAMAGKQYHDALDHYRRAVQAVPGSGKAHAGLGRALAALGKHKEAAAALNKARKLDSALDTEVRLCFDLAIVYAKLSEYAKAVGEYDRAERIIARASGPLVNLSFRATMHYNAADSLMAMGQLDAAIERYRMALRASPRYTLALWGLAVALDRDGQNSAAYAAIHKALAIDPKMAHLTSKDVFFVPDGELYYYVGLGNEVRGKRKEAAKAFATYLEKVRTSPWRVRARTHLNMLSKQKQSRPKRKRKRLAPKPNQTVRSDTRGSELDALRYRIQDQYYGLRRCYRTAHKRHQKRSGKRKTRFEGTIVVRVTTGHGRIKSRSKKKARRRGVVRVISDDLRDAGLRRCVVTAIERNVLQTRSGGERLTVTVPLQFKP